LSIGTKSPRLTKLRKAWSWKSALVIIGGGLITLGVAGELLVQVLASRKETELRTANDNIFTILNKKAAEANERAATADSDGKERVARVDAESKVRIAKVEADAKLRIAELQRESEELHRHSLELAALLTEANQKVEEARQTTLMLVELNRPRIIATAATSESGENPSLEALKKFAGMQVIVEHDDDDDSRRAAGKIMEAVEIFGWRVIQPVPRSAPIAPGVFVQSYLAAMPPTQADCEVLCDEQNSRAAADALMALLGQNGWSGIASNFGPRTAVDALPPNTVRVLVGPRPPATFLNPLVIKWRKEFQEMLEENARKKAKAAMDMQKQ
jgi:hypothetical protein